MTASYGSASGHVAVGIDVSMSPTTVTKDTASVTLTWKIYLRNDSGWWFSADNTTLTLSNAISESFGYSYTVGSSSESILVLTRNVSVPTVYGSSVTKTLSVAVSGLSSGGTPHESRSFTIPSRPPQSPHNATAASASYVSDKQINVSWTRPSDASTAEWIWTNAVVQRQKIGSTSWSTIATLSGSATSYSDTSVVANSSFTYRVYGKNVSGSSGYTTTAAIPTTPAAPTSVAAKRSGANIVVSWTNPAPAVTSFTIYDNGSSVATNVSPTATSWTHTNASTANAHQYTMKAVAGSRTSALSAASNSVTLLSAPAAPSQLSPSSVVALGDQVTFTWQHNSTDTTDQAAFDLKYSIDGGSTWVDSGKITSNASSYAPAMTNFSAAETVQWQVMTWGDYATGSPWSAVASFNIAAMPTVSIQSPADASTVTAPSTTISWSFFQSAGNPQVTWAVSIVDAVSGDEIANASGADASSSYTTDEIFANGGSYTITVDAQGSSGLWAAPDAANVTVSYALPLLPDVTVTPDLAHGVVELLVSSQSDGVAPETVDLLIERQLANESTWETLASNVGTSTDLIDNTAPLVGAIQYRISSISALPSMNSTTVSVTGAATDLPTDSTSILSGGPGFSQLARFVATPQADMTVGRERALNQFDGRTLPVSTSSTFIDRSVAVTAKLLPAIDDIDATYESLETLFTLPDPFLYRDALGRRLFCSLSAGALPSAFLAAVTFTVTEIDAGTSDAQLALWAATS